MLFVIALLRWGYFRTKIKKKRFLFFIAEFLWRWWTSSSSFSICKAVTTRGYEWMLSSRLNIFIWIERNRKVYLLTPIDVWAVLSFILDINLILNIMSRKSWRIYWDSIFCPLNTFMRKVLIWIINWSCRDCGYVRVGSTLYFGLLNN